MTDLSQIAAKAGSAGSNAMMVGYWALVVALVIVILAFIIYRFSFNCKVRIRYLTHDKDQVSDKKGKVVKDRKDGVEKLIIRMGLFRTVKMPTPPPEATSIDLKGRRCFTVEFGDDGSNRYIVRKKLENTYTPLNTNDRLFYINEAEKAMQRQKKSIHDLIAQAIPYIALCIIFGMLLAFWGDIVEPLTAESARWRAWHIEVTEKEAEILGHLKEIIKREQIVPSLPQPAGQPPPETPPPDQ